MKKNIFSMVMFVLLAPVLAFAQSGTDFTAPLCGKCHQPEANIIRGVLKGVSFKEMTINLDLNGHFEIINFRPDTKVLNISSLRDIAHYKGDGFRVFFVDYGNSRMALQIARLDPMSLLAPGNVLGIDDLERLMSQQVPLTIIDIRPPQLFKAGHILGAVNIPAHLLKESNIRLPLDRGAKLILYGNGGRKDVEAAISIESQGYRNVSLFVGGFPAWEKIHYSVCSMSYAQRHRGQGTFYVHLQEGLNSGGPLGMLPKDLDVSLSSLVGDKTSLPQRSDTPIVVYGYGQERGASAIKAMGYRQVKILARTSLPWAGKSAARKIKNCY